MNTVTVGARITNPSIRLFAINQLSLFIYYAHLIQLKSQFSYLKFCCEEPDPLGAHAALNGIIHLGRWFWSLLDSACQRWAHCILD